MFTFKFKTSQLFISIVICLTILFQAKLFSEHQNKQRNENHIQDIEQIQCKDRGNRIEGINCPREVAGADIEIVSVLALPQDSKRITEGDTIYLRWNVPEKTSYFIKVRETRTNYLMMPESLEVVDGEFRWTADEVLVPLSNIMNVEINYSDLLPLAYRRDSTPRRAHVFPMILSSKKSRSEVSGYHFVFRANANFKIIYKFYQDTVVIKQDHRTGKANDYINIYWDGMIGNDPAPEGECLLLLRGEATRNQKRVPIESRCYFFHKNHIK